MKNGIETYWQNLWNGKNLDCYKRYVGNNSYKSKYLKIFKENNIKYVCDAACGFGKFSVQLAQNGFKVSGFDIAKDAVRLTIDMLKEFNLDYCELKTCSLTSIDFKDDLFDGVVCSSVIDHLSLSDAKLALKELKRITKPCGLIYFSFDQSNEDDFSANHEIQDDGSMLYLEGARKGLLFNPYKEERIFEYLRDEDIIYYNKAESGQKEAIISNEK